MEFAIQRDLGSFGSTVLCKKAIARSSRNVAVGNFLCSTRLRDARDFQKLCHKTSPLSIPINMAYLPQNDGLLLKNKEYSPYWQAVFCWY